jgi:hypothetical protein
MNKDKKTSVEIRNSVKGLLNKRTAVDVQEWRDAYHDLLKLFPDDKTLYAELATIDSYYATRKGGQELYKVKQNLASIQRTVRAVKALYKYLFPAGSKIQKIINRHGLTIPTE